MRQGATGVNTPGKADGAQDAKKRPTEGNTGDGERTGKRGEKGRSAPADGKNTQF